MLPADQRLRELYEKWFNKTITEAEKNEFLALLNEGITREQITPAIEHVWNTLEDNGAFTIAQRKALSDKILQALPSPETHRYTTTHRQIIKTIASIAAAGILLITAAAVFWPSGEKTTAQKGQNQQAYTVAPGKEGAVLTLADGTQVSLDSMENGLVARQGETHLLLEKGSISYIPSASNTSVPSYNTMTTARGRQFSVILPDGSKVWLNAESALKFPTAFTPGVRTVELTGEAYFEVTKQKGQPFRVLVKNTVAVDVLGTHFNVNAYDNEKNIQTTLLEGAVKVASLSPGSGNSVLLKPGQQAVSDQSAGGKGETKLIPVADVEKAVSWKNGLFNFNGLELKEVMQQLERWYDIEVKYQGDVPRITLKGEIYRSTTLQDVLASLEKTGVYFELKGRTLQIR